MPHLLVWEDAGVYVRFTGTVTPEELVGLYDEIASDPRSDTIHYAITDYLGASHVEHMTRADLIGLAARERGAAYSNATVWRAAIAVERSAIEFLESFQSLRVSPDLFQIFTTHAQARAWLATHPLLRG
jgi:hypothetical protein